MTAFPQGLAGSAAASQVKNLQPVLLPSSRAAAPGGAGPPLATA